MGAAQLCYFTFYGRTALVPIFKGSQSDSKIIFVAYASVDDINIIEMAKFNIDVIDNIILQMQ